MMNDYVIFPIDEMAHRSLPEGGWGAAEYSFENGGIWTGEFKILGHTIEEVIMKILLFDPKATIYSGRSSFLPLALEYRYIDDNLVLLYRKGRRKVRCIRSSR